MVQPNIHTTWGTLSDHPSSLRDALVYDQAKMLTYVLINTDLFVLKT